MLYHATPKANLMEIIGFHIDLVRRELFFYPNEARLYPIYAKAQELKIPVILHIGPSAFKGTRMKHCDPIYLDDVAVDFPNLKIIMAHSGRGFSYDKCFFLSRFHRNIYMDITGLPAKNLPSCFPELPLSSTIEGILYRNAERVLFGSQDLAKSSLFPCQHQFAHRFSQQSFQLLRAILWLIAY